MQSSEILSNTQIINNVKDCVNLVQRLITSGRPIAFDCEWVTKSHLEIPQKITLLQISDCSGRAYIIDLLKCRDLIHSGHIDKLLESRKIIKVVHDCRLDREYLKQLYDVELRNVFDTQLAYSALMHQENHSDKPWKKLGQRIGLNNLYAYFDLPMNPEKDNIDHERWDERPLKKDMIVYAASDVFWLLDVYSLFLDSLYESFQQQVMHESNQGATLGEYSWPLKRPIQRVEPSIQRVQQSIQRVQQSSQRVENEPSFLNSNLFLGAAGLAAATCFAVWAYNRNTRDGRR